MMKRTILVAILGLLAACGGEKDAETTRGAEQNGPIVSFETRDAGARRAVAEVPKDFSFLRYAVDETGTTPAFCLTFSAPLNPATDYSPYVTIEGEIALQVEGSRLCMGGLTYGQEKRVTLRAGLPSAGGKKLSQDESFTLTFDDRPSVVNFIGEGIILPRVDADGLAIQTVNVDNVQVVIRRLNDRALVFRSITSGFSAGNDEYGYGGYRASPDELGVEIWKGQVSTNGPTNAATTTVLPLAEMIGELQAGAYYIEIDDAEAISRGEYQPARARRWIIVTDLALTAYQGNGGMDITVRSLQTAKPRGGAEVKLIARSNEILATRQADRSGQVRFDAPLMNGTDGNQPRLIVVYGDDGDFAMLDLDRSPVDLSSQAVSGRTRTNGADGFVYLDRGIYRPGENVEASFLLRDAAGMAITDRPGALVLYKPNGIEQDRFRFDSLSSAGGITHRFTLPTAAPRGQWRIAAEVDGADFAGSKSFAVEDFVPQRVELTLVADTDKPMGATETRTITARARFLYGAPGAGLKITGTARVERDFNAFADWENYRFGKHDEQFGQELFELPKTVADGSGEAQLPLAMNKRSANSTLPLRVRAVVEVEEPGGRAIADDLRIPYRPRAVYYGIKQNFDGRAERNSELSFDLIAVNGEGTAKATDLAWRLIRRDYNYDWYRTDGGEWRWRRTQRVVPIEDGVISLTGDAAAKISTPKLDWGDYALIVSVDGEDLASTGFWVGWGGYATEGTEAPDQVRVSGPETSPMIGAKAQVIIKAPYAGLAEVVVATDRVLSVQQIKIKEAGAQISLPVTEEWGAGAYIMVSVYTPRDAVTQPRPRRAVGVTYIPVNVADRTLDVALDTPELVAPNQTLDVTLRVPSAPAGERVFATIAAVDEGILLLTNYQSPNPVDWFFGKPNLEISLYDDYGRLLDPNQGAAAPVRSGGDQIGGAGLTVVPTKTVALFSGEITLDASGNATVPLMLPDFNGELRLMVVAWSQSALGAATQPMTVRDKVPAELILPRFLSPGDQSFGTATLDNVDGTSGTYTVKFRAEGPVSIEQEAKELALDKGKREDFDVAVTAQGIGIADLSIDVTGPDDFKVTSSYPIEVRSAFWPVSRITRTTLAPGADYTPAQDALAGFADGSGNLHVSVAATPIDTAALYGSLYRYPYACTEQLVSRTLPLLYAKQLASLAGGEGPDGASRFVRDTIETLLSRQNASGAFGLWRVGDNQASPWLGAYAADFLYRAKERGYPVPDAAVERALKVLQPLSQGKFYYSSGYKVSMPNTRWTSDTAERLRTRSSAYALYVLARAGEADRSRLRYMHDEMLAKIDSPLAKAHIGAGLAAMGDQSRARSAFKAAIKAVGYKNSGDWYQTPLRDRAAILALLTEAGYDDLATDLIADFIADQPEPARMTTQEKAFTILASRAIAGDAAQVKVAYSGTAANPAQLQLDALALSEAGAITNAGERPLYISALATGTPIAPPEAVAEGVQVEKTITDIYGNNVDLSALKRGDRMVVMIAITPKRRAIAPYIMADLLPAGFEIEAIVPATDGGPNGPYAFLGDLAYANLTEARDDRFIVAIDGRGGSTYRFAYLARAVTPGNFTLPGAVVEDMYKTDVFARSASGRTTITP